MARGYVYAVRAKGDPHVKIGRTSRDPAARLRELNNTSVVNDFRLEFALRVGSACAVEALAHRMLSDRRVRSDREFFRCSPRRARRTIERAAARSGTASMGGGAPPSLAHRLLRAVSGTTIALTGLAVTAAFLEILIAVPAARGEDAPLVLGAIAAFGLLTVWGCRIARGPKAS